MDVQRSFADEGKEGTGSGKLYLVATPIGNLADMTYRAVDILREADVIAAEDTRQTRKLLSHYDIGGTLVSYHEHNKRTSGPQLIDRLVAGQSVALVSDAGLPGISDPGEDLVRLAIEAGIAVVPVPGASAALTALIVSGLSSAAFRFVGFLPRERNKLADALERLQREEDTLIVYESPHRLVATLTAMRDVLGNRRIVLARELTKKHEEIARGTLDEALAFLADHPPRGEYVVVVDGFSEEAEAAAAPADAWWSPLTVAEHVRHYEDKLGLARKEAMKRTALDRGVSRRDVYQTLLNQ